MVQKFQNELYSIKDRVIEAIRNEAANKGGEIELSTEGNELTIDLSPMRLDYCARFEILGISGAQIKCKDVEADIYCSFGLNEINIENLIFIYEQI